MVGKTENVFVLLSSWLDKRFIFRIAYLPFSFDVAKCVISHDEHAYYGETMRHLIFFKYGGPQKIVPQSP